ncbi:uncharacterized protein BO80DRAFT_55560 [Aspergillus ibericus CBS 121593]|uniref:Uncharacterized protein n=1 Tax=Aspergillus ibericus CBS 121593 TaxID=1448316 RepID=A0A395H216_9EURO|nr:hypothetical protein BO80DRAFT_55560 [Aspergillus ibericus CBS 121593]RAL01713.1 hypothetical protein BO80DRAFT_55560 [Aspergillus ibericus CBS 121593]
MEKNVISLFLFSSMFLVHGFTTFASVFLLYSNVFLHHLYCFALRLLPLLDSVSDENLSMSLLLSSTLHTFHFLHYFFGFGWDVVHANWLDKDKGRGLKNAKN